MNRGRLTHKGLRNSRGFSYVVAEAYLLAGLTAGHSSSGYRRSARYDKTWNCRWNICYRLLLVSRGTDHHVNGHSLKAWCPDRLASSARRARIGCNAPSRLQF